MLSECFDKLKEQKQGLELDFFRDHSFVKALEKKNGEIMIIKKDFGSNGEFIQVQPKKIVPYLRSDYVCCLFRYTNERDSKEFWHIIQIGDIETNNRNLVYKPDIKSLCLHFKLDIGPDNDYYGCREYNDYIYFFRSTLAYKLFCYEHKLVKDGSL